jgi:hypothetical protein
MVSLLILIPFGTTTITTAIATAVIDVNRILFGARRWFQWWWWWW